MNNKSHIRKNAKSLKVNAIVNTVKSLVSLLFPLITFPYVSRILGVNQMGKYNFANSIVNYFLLIAALGISSYAIREGTQYREVPEKINKFASEMFSINVFSTVISYIALLCSIILIRRFDSCRTEILIFSIEIVATTFGIEWVFNIYEDFVYIALRSLMFQCISLALLFIFVRKPGDLDRYVWITVLSLTGNNIFNWAHAKKYCRIRFTHPIDWKKHLKPILIIFSTSIAVTIYVNSDSTMLGFIINDNNYSVGLYYVATKIYSIFKNVIVAFLVVLIPRFSFLVHKENSKQEISELFNKLSMIVITIVTPLVLGMIMLASDIIRIVSGEEYLPAVPSFRILMAACLFSFFAYLFAQCILIPNRREKQFFIATIISSIINIALNFVLIPIIQEIGAAITTLLAEFVTMILVIRGSRDYVDLKLQKQDISSVVVGTVFVGIICFVGNRLITSMPLRVVSCIVLSISVYYLILKGMGNSVVDEIEATAQRRLHLKKKAEY